MNGPFGTWTDRAETAPVADVGLLVGDGSLMVIAPHPDDESIACSALLLDAARQNRALVIVALTDGDASHPGSVAVPPPQLARIRTHEQMAAVEALGCSHAQWLRLGLPDGASRWHPGRLAAVDALAEKCRQLGVTAVVAPHPDDPHPDHHAAAELALDLRAELPQLRILFYEVWTCRLARDAPFRQDDLTPFRVATDREAKRRAIDCHASQLGHVVPDAARGFTLPDWFLALHDSEFERLSWLHMPGEAPAASHFDAIYKRSPDPWDVRTSPYELGKRDAARALLGDARFEHALEAGCGEGCLAGDLLLHGQARRATGIDQAEEIVERARKSAPEGLRLVRGRLPDDLPEGPYDLVIFSELLYYLPERDLERLAALTRMQMVPGAAMLIVSYLGDTETPLDARAGADFFIALFGPELQPVSRRSAERFRIDLLRWRP